MDRTNSSTSTRYSNEMSFAALSDPDWWYLDSRAPREPASTLRIAWLAGVFDGEGAISGHSHIKIMQKERWLLDQVHHYFGGRVRAT